MVVCVIMALSQKSTMCPFFVSLTTKGALAGRCCSLGVMVMNSRASLEASRVPGPLVELGGVGTWLSEVLAKETRSLGERCCRGRKLRSGSREGRSLCLSSDFRVIILVISRRWITRVPL